MASEMWWARTDSEPSRSAIVLDTLRILSYALALRPSLSIAVSRSLTPFSSGFDAFLTMEGDIWEFEWIFVLLNLAF